MLSAEDRDVVTQISNADKFSEEEINYLICGAYYRLFKNIAPRVICSLRNYMKLTVKEVSKLNTISRKITEYECSAGLEGKICQNGLFDSKNPNGMKMTHVFYGDIGVDRDDDIDLFINEFIKIFINEKVADGIKEKQKYTY